MHLLPTPLGIEFLLQFPLQNRRDGRMPPDRALPSGQSLAIESIGDGPQVTA